MKPCAIEPVQDRSVIRRYQWTLAICCCALMWITFSLPGRSGPGTAQSLDVVALFKLGVRGIVGLLMLHMTWRLWDVSVRKKTILLLLPWLLFGGWATISVLWSPLRFFSFGQVASLVIQIMLAVNVALLWRKEADTEFLLRRLTTMLVLFSGMVALANIALPSIGSLDRLNSGMVHPTVAGATASLGLVLLLGCRTIWGWHWTNRLFWPGVFASMCLLYLAANRTALFLAVVLSAAMFFVYANRTLVSSAVMAGCLCAVVYLAVDPGFSLLKQGLNSTGAYVTRGNAEDVRDVSGREELWEVMWNSFQGSPVLGHGYFVSSAEGEVYAWYTWANWTAHNVVLQALVSTGIIGAALVVWGIVLPAWRLWRARGQNDETQRYSRFMLLVGFWFLTWGLFNESFLGPISPESVVFFMLLGLTVGYVPCTEANREPSGAQLLGPALPSKLGGAL